MLLFVDDGATAHLHHAPRAGGESGVVRDQHQRRPRFAIEPKEHLDDRLAGLGVEISGRFIGEENLRPMDESPRQRHPLLFAAGELQRIMFETIGQANLREDIRGFLLPAVFAAEFQRHEHILDRGERGDELEVLKHEAHRDDCATPRVHPGRARRGLPVEAHRARGGVVESGAEAEQRGLAAARGADDRARVARIQREMDVAQHGQFVPGTAVGLAESADLEDGRFDSLGAALDARRASD